MNGTPNSEFTLDRAFVSDIIIYGKIYMRRYLLVNRKRFGIRLHHIRLPDYGRDLHDHPFDFLTIVVKGSYTEILEGGRMIRHRLFVPHYRRAETAHLIVEVPPKGTWTLVFRGRLRRRWGFWVDHKWVHHSDYDERPVT